MGWCSGSELADRLWKTVERSIPKKKRQEIARDWVEIFESEDCDTMLESHVGDVAGIEHDEDEGSYFPWQK